MNFFSTTYKGYTITLINNQYYISTMPYVFFLTQQAAKNYIDKIKP